MHRSAKGEKVIKGYVNIFSESGPHTWPRALYETRAQADEYATRSYMPRVCCVEVCDASQIQILVEALRFYARGVELEHLRCVDIGDVDNHPEFSNLKISGKIARQALERLKGERGDK